MLPSRIPQQLHHAIQLSPQRRGIDDVPEGFVSSRCGLVDVNGTKVVGEGEMVLVEPVEQSFGDRGAVMGLVGGWSSSASGGCLRAVGVGMVELKEEGGNIVGNGEGIGGLRAQRALFGCGIGFGAPQFGELGRCFQQNVMPISWSSPHFGVQFGDDSLAGQDHRVGFLQVRWGLMVGQSPRNPRHRRLLPHSSIMTALQSAGWLLTGRSSRKGVHEGHLHLTLLLVVCCIFILLLIIIFILRHAEAGVFVVRKSAGSMTAPERVISQVKRGIVGGFRSRRRMADGRRRVVRQPRRWSSRGRRRRRIAAQRARVGCRGHPVVVRHVVD